MHTLSSSNADEKDITNKKTEIVRHKSLYTMIPLINVRTVCMLRKCGSVSLWRTFLYFYLFCPTAKGSNLYLKPDLKEFTRKLKCREKY